MRVLPNELQREWGRFAYPLRPKIPGLADFDRWIEGIVGVEEFMGAATSSKVHQTGSNCQVKFGLTVMATGLKSPPAKSNACGVCRADPGHPLAFCLVFIDTHTHTHTHLHNELKRWRNWIIASGASEEIIIRQTA